MVYNALPLWSPDGVTEPYKTRYQWPGDDGYEALISDPANALGALAGKALLKYVEVKAVIGGTTAIQGSAKMAHPYDGLAGPKRRVRDLHDGQEVGLPVGAAAAKRRRL